MYEITIRTVGGMPLLRPTAELREGFAGIFGRALACHPTIRLHASNYITNHGHLQLTGTAGDDVPEFMCQINAGTSRLVQDLVGRRGPVWDRYAMVPIVDDLAAERRLAYLIANGTKEGLISHPLEWPGFSTTRSLVTGEPLVGRLRIREPGKLKSKSEVLTYPIELARLPHWASLSDEEHRAKLRDIVDTVVAAARRDRAGRPCMGVPRILAQDPFVTIPIEDSPPPVAHYSDDDALYEFITARRRFIDEHRRAAAARRKGSAATFPVYGFPCAPPYERGR